MHCHSTTSYTRPSPNQPSKPFLKWAGGKQRLLHLLLPYIPKGRRLIEPFVGAGSVSLASQFQSFLINDANPDLISVWSALKNRPIEFITRAEQYFRPEFNSRESYEIIRHEFNCETDRFERAVRFVYLNRFGFNGLYRVNRQGRLNVPYGYPNKPPGFPVEALEQAALKLESFDIRCGGYGHILELAGEGDVVYCDPPYLSAQPSVSSISYTTERFGLNEFEQLLNHCERAALRGAKVVLSQVDNELARRALKTWSIARVAVPSSISSSVQSRCVRYELIATTF